MTCRRRWPAQSAAKHGVGLVGWFQWFGGGSTPGNYSVITPYLSSLLGATLVGVLATIAITPLVRRAVVDTAHPHMATWVATFAAGCNIWSGRIPFALGCAVGVVAVIGLRERRPSLAVGGIVGSTLCSPVSGAFLALAFAAVFLVERPFRRLALWTCVACGVTLVGIALFFGNPGNQPFSLQSSLTTAAAALIMLLARPAAVVRLTLVATAVISPLLLTFPTAWAPTSSGCPGSACRARWSRRPRRHAALAGGGRRGPGVALCLQATVLDLVRSTAPAAAAAFYTPLIGQLKNQPDLRNHRLEVVQSGSIHTAAYALLGHAALAGGYETQEQNKLNAVLSDPTLNAVSYKVWLDNNAVGYVAVNRRYPVTTPEYTLAARHRPAYLVPVSSSPTWSLYRVSDATPIVPRPQQLLSADQAQLTIKVPCACAFPVRVRFSKFLTLRPVRGTGPAGDARDDGTGWTVLRTPAAGTYRLQRRRHPPAALSRPAVWRGSHRRSGKLSRADSVLLTESQSGEHHRDGGHRPAICSPEPPR